MAPTKTDRDHAEDMGYVICDGCETTFIPLPGFANDGHQCDSDGTTSEYEIR